MFSPQIHHHRLKLLFSFMLGVALTAVLFTSTQFYSRQCAGSICGNSPINPPSSTFFIPTLKHVARTFPVPSNATYSNSMISRTSKQACNQTEYCEEYLSPEEKTHFTQCSNRCVNSSKKYGPEMDGVCHFMNGRGRLPVALVSFPGSGNTWTRGLLEKVTGVCTGVSPGLYYTCWDTLSYMYIDPRYSVG